MRRRGYSLRQALWRPEWGPLVEEKGVELPVKSGFLGQEIRVELSPRWELKLKGDWAEELEEAAESVLSDINAYPERFGVNNWGQLGQVFESELLQELGLDSFQHGVMGLLLPKLSLKSQAEDGLSLELSFYNKTNWSPRGEGETWGVTLGGSF